MMQKLLIGGLAVGIIVVIAFGLYDAAQVPDTEDDKQEIAQMMTDIPTATPTAAEPTTTPASIDATPEATAESITNTLLPAESTSEPILQVQAQDTMGDAWQAEGTISTLEDFGFTLATDNGDYFVELGPPDYWQAQEITLAAGDAVQVDGYYNGDQVHARVVRKNDAELVIRAESGQPMWAGGVENGEQQAAGGVMTQITAEDWITITGEIANVQNGRVTLAADDGTMLDLQMGRPEFWQSQGIVLQVGDPTEVLGFWSNEQFMVGEIRKKETGETIMLRDPNGRQLWAGPGRNGSQSGNGQAGTQGNAGNQGQGNQYRGGRDE